MKAVCLLSGELDSATCLGWARHEGLECSALSFDYGQRHHVELAAARNIANALGAVDYRVAKIDRGLRPDDTLFGSIRVPVTSHMSAWRKRSLFADRVRHAGDSR
jgi:7-cyano-7-deazaguanine synthase